MDEVEPIILDSTVMRNKLVTAIDTVCKVLREVRQAMYQRKIISI